MSSREISVKEFIEKLYEKYIEVVKKEEQQKKIEQIIANMNVPYEWSKIWHRREACWEYLTMVSRDLEEKLKEIWEYIYRDFRFVSAGIHVTTCDIVGHHFNNQIIGEYIAVEIDDGYLNYIKIAEIEGVSVYIVVSDERINGDDC